MRRTVLALVLVLALVPACKRHRPPKTSSNESAPASPVARVGAPGTGNAPAAPGPGIGPGQAAAPPPGVPSWHGGDRPPPGPERGTATINVFGTPLDGVLLYGLTLNNGAFRLDGQGLSLVGRMSRDWAASVGTPAAILPDVAGIGASEFDRPGLGVAKITGGQIVTDQVVSRDPPRVKGRLRMQIQGPDGKVDFTGTFEVGVVVK